MPGYIPIDMQGRANGGAQQADAFSQIRALEERLRMMQWQGAPPIEMQQVQAQIQQLRQGAMKAQAGQQYELQRTAARQPLAGPGGAANPSANNRRNEAMMLSNYLSSLFGIDMGGMGGGGGNME